MIEFKPFQPELLPDVSALMDSSVSRENIWKWQFKNWNKGAPILAYHEGELVGFNGIMPVRIKRNNLEIDGVWSCDFFVAKESRQHGVGSKIKDKLKSQHPNLIMSLGISDKALSVLKRKGWKSYNGVTIYRRKLSPSDLKSKLICALQKILSTIYWPITKNRQPFNINLHSELPATEELELLWTGVKNEYGTCIARNAEYLNWRYGTSPDLEYRFLVVREKHQLAAFMVYSQSGSSLSIVDYIGPRKNYFLKYKLLKYLESSNPNALNINFITSDKHWKAPLYASGYYRSPSKQRFVVYSGVMDNTEKDDWYITSGDSDGEIIKNFFCLNKSISITEAKKSELKQLTTEEFYRISKSWETLLGNSDAHPLFMSWGWQFSWWETWSNALNLSLKLFAHYEQGQLIALFPMFEGSFKSELIGSSTAKLSFIGSYWRNEKTFRTEFLSPIVRKGHEEKAISAFIQFLKKTHPNQEIILPDAELTSPVIKLLVDGFQQAGNATVLSRQTDTGVYVDTHQIDFETYKKNLSVNARRSIFGNRDKLLEKFPNIELEQINIENIQQFFGVLNQLHIKRWGKPFFTKETLDFNCKMLTRLLSTQDSAKLMVNILKHKDLTLSVQYNIKVKQQVINLQSGFNDQLGSKLALGLIHFGMTLEDLFPRPIVKFDFLVGKGKNADYKSKFSSLNYQLNTIQIVRSWHGKMLYEIYRITPEKIRKGFLKLIKKIK